MQTKLGLAVLVIIVGLNLVACAIATTSGNTLNHTDWQLLSLDNGSVNSDTAISLSFADNKLSGTDGCNRYHGSYLLKGKQLTINKQLASTMMACPESVSQQASAYIATLTAVTAYKIDNQQLVLIDASGKTRATFSKQTLVLGGTSWLVTSSNNGKQAVVSILNDSKITVNFSDDGRFSGSGGCNDYLAHYKVAGKKITIGSIGTTRRMCFKPDGVMEQEAKFFKALATAASYRIEGKRLELRTADNALAVTLVAANPVP
jgi:heat shock protein HslJ